MWLGGDGDEIQVLAIKEINSISNIEDIYLEEFTTRVGFEAGYNICFNLS